MRVTDEPWVTVEADRLHVGDAGQRVLDRAGDLGLQLRRGGADWVTVTITTGNSMFGKFLIGSVR